MENNSLLVKASGAKLDLLKNLLANTAGGASQAVFWDKFYHPEDSLGESFKAIFDPRQYEGKDSSRQQMGILNTVLGTLGTKYLRNSANLDGSLSKAEALAKADSQFNKGVTAAMMAPTKDLVIAGTRLAGGVDKSLPSINSALNRPQQANPEGMTTRDKLLAAALGVGALGIGAYGVSRINKRMAEQNTLSNAGRVTLTLPTKDPNDVETQVSIPLDDVGVSAKSYNQLGRDVRRRLRGEGTERKNTYLHALENGMDPEEANLLKASATEPAPSILAGSHIKSIAEAHAPKEELEEPTEEKEPVKPPDQLLKYKVSEQEKRIKQLEKFLGQANGNKLSQVRSNLRGIAKVAYAPTIGEVNGTPEAFGAKGGVQGLNIHKPMLFGSKFNKLKEQVQPFLSNSENPFIKKIFGKTQANPDVIVPML